MYLVNTVIFNEVHLRRKNERLGWVLVYVYYLPYKIVLTLVNVASCYWSLYKYARYFAKRHPKVIEDEKAVEVIVRLEETQTAVGAGAGGFGRRLTVHTISTRQTPGDYDQENVDPFEQANTEGVVAIDYAFAPTAQFEDTRRASLPETIRDAETWGQNQLSSQLSRSSQGSRRESRSAGVGR